MKEFIDSAQDTWSSSPSFSSSSFFSLIFLLLLVPITLNYHTSHPNHFQPSILIPLPIYSHHHHLYPLLTPTNILPYTQHHYPSHLSSPYSY